MKKTVFISSLVALLVSLCTIGIYQFFFAEEGKTLKIEHIDSTPAKSAVYTLNDEGEVVPLDFTKIAEQVMDAVVHIQSTQTLQTRNDRRYKNREIPDPFRDFFGDDFFDQFFGPQYRQQPDMPQARIGSGSGVIINENGYIVTNNHVIADADDIEVVLHDNRTYKASVIGTDPTTDLALIQIKESDLPTLPFVNSDEVQVGEWVLAVGNPFNLNSTVTAGIVSAKARSINILRDQYAVESFIQTDAAINPGNSGGALVNLEGGLIGINTAIASPTGAYAGYGFAVPSNIVSKVVEDLLKYGSVQRGYLGVMIRGINSTLAEEEDLEVMRGVYVDSLLENSAAEEAGIQVGDVIVSIDGIEVNTAPKLQELIARKRPGDKLEVKVNRDGTEKTFTVTLNNREGNTEIVAREKKETLSMLGAEFETLDKETAKELDIEGGVKVSRLYPGKLRRDTDMQEGFIITKVDDKPVTNVDQLAEALEGKKGGVLFEGVYEDRPGVFYYGFGI